MKYHIIFFLILTGCSSMIVNEGHVKNLSANEFYQVKAIDLIECRLNGDMHKISLMAKNNFEKNIRNKIFSFIGSDGYSKCYPSGVPNEFDYSKYDVKCLKPDIGYPDDICQSAYASAYNALVFKHLGSR